MVERTIEDLTRDLAERRRLGEPAPVVLLGAGASAEAGIGTMAALYAFMHVKDRDEFEARIAEITDNERYRLLAEFLQTQDPLEVTAGYRALAALCEAAYFDIILTTNFDPLLDDALVGSGMRRRDYLLLINGVLRADRLQALMGSRSPRVKVLKLHGDLFHRFMAWTPEEMETYLEEIAARVAPALAMRDFLVVGNSLWDERVRALVVNAGGSVWYVTPGAVPPQVAAIDNVRAIAGTGQTFEHLFPALAKNLGAEGAPRWSQAYIDRLIERGEIRFLEGGLARNVEKEGARAEFAATTDDLIAATVGLAPNTRAAAHGSGFVVADPRVIVTDGFAARGQRFDVAKISVITSTGRRLTTRPRHLFDEHPFGPWVLEVPAELTVPGLRVSAEPFEPGAPLHIAVAAGERVGLSSGEVVGPLQGVVGVAPLGDVRDLVELRCAVRPGSSGAPVVDADFVVRGFVAAGSTDPNRPVTFMYPAARWQPGLGGLPPRTEPVSRPRTPGRRPLPRKRR